MTGMVGPRHSHLSSNCQETFAYDRSSSIPQKPSLRQFVKTKAPTEAGALLSPYPDVSFTETT